MRFFCRTVSFNLVTTRGQTESPLLPSRVSPFNFSTFLRYFSVYLLGKKKKIKIYYFKLEKNNCEKQLLIITYPFLLGKKNSEEERWAPSLKLNKWEKQKLWDEDLVTNENWGFHWDFLVLSKEKKSFRVKAVRCFFSFFKNPLFSANQSFYKGSPSSTLE